MASERRLDSWTLTDGMRKPFPLEEACEVAEALEKQGILQEPYKGENCLLCEWIAGRRWRYVSAFELGEEGDERTYLSFAHLNGTGQLFVNGEEVCRFSEGRLEIDITGWLIPGENQAALEFDPVLWEKPAQTRPLPRIGISGGARLVTGSFLSVREARFSADEAGNFACEMQLEAHTAGRYLFRYGLANEDGLVESKEIWEKLPAARRAVQHRFALAQKPENPILDVKLEIEKAGSGCRTLHAQVHAGKRSERIAVCAGPMTQQTVETLRALGADGVYPKQARPMGNCLWEMPVVDAAGESLPVETAMPTFEKMCALAGEEKFWPAGSFVWRLNGAQELNERALEERFGAGVCANPERLSRILRFWQAERLQEAALQARCAGKTVCVEQIISEWPRYADSALIEADGEKRPAFYALSGVWRQTRAFAVLPENGVFTQGTNLQLPICLSGPRGEARAIRVGAYTLGGKMVGGSTFAAPAFGEAGMFSLSAAPEEKVIILRCELMGTDETVLSVSDQVLWADQALLSLPGARIRQEEEMAQCEGDTAALGFACEGVYRALLPGECVRTGGKAEWLNR